MRLNIEQTDTLVAYVDHAIQCELAACDQCPPLKEAAASVLSTVREQEVKQQAIVVENVLGGADRKSRPCIGDGCSTKTTLRCTVCKMPVCGRCIKSSGAHPHTVRVRSDVKVTADITKWGHWDIDGAECKDVRVTQEMVDRPQWQVRPGQPLQHMKDVQRWYDKNGIEVKYSHKVTGQRSIRHLGRVLKHGDVFLIAAEGWNPTYLELLD